MKNFLLSLVLLSGLVFTSCGDMDKYENTVETRSKSDLIILKTDEDVPKTYGIETMKFKYENHQYIIFTSGYGKTSRMGVVHDPNCPNHNNNEIRNDTIENYNYYSY